MQAYSQQFAKIYNLRWGNFARRIAPHILGFYQNAPISQKNRSVLDLCCGTGHLAARFLEQGYAVVGVDLSGPMLRYARENTRPFVENGRAHYIQGDASAFALGTRFGLVVSTYDSLNHLEDFPALQRCFRCVFEVLEDDGYFIFDLNTRLGLQQWNNIMVQDGDKEIITINRGLYDGRGPKAWMKISGFVRTRDDLYERFEETIFNTVFSMKAVQSALHEAGWRRVHFARIQSLESPLENPESEHRVFIIAQKGR